MGRYPEALELAERAMRLFEQTPARALGLHAQQFELRDAALQVLPRLPMLLHLGEAKRDGVRDTDGTHIFQHGVVFK